jgi:mannose-6-phosphate isomerase-like protein (cupin superfamily)
MNRSTWAGKSSKRKKPWGYEIAWTGLFRGKEIHICEGMRTSLKFNVNKSEILYVSTGEVSIECADESHFSDPVESPSRLVKLGPGDFINVQAGCPYRVTALRDSIVFEISDNARDIERVIIEDDYGRKVDQTGRWIFNPPKTK